MENKPIQICVYKNNYYSCFLNLFFLRFSMVASLATPTNLTADPNGNLGPRPQTMDLVTRVLDPNQTVSSISDKIGDKVKNSITIQNYLYSLQIIQFCTLQ